MRAPLLLLTLALVALTALVPIRTFAAYQASAEAGGSVGPNVGDRLRVEDFDRNEIAAVSVTRLEDPAPQSAAEPGFRTVSVDFAVENVGSEPISLNYYDFSIVDTRGFVYGPKDHFLNFERLDDPNAGAGFGGFEPGQAMGGSVDFQLPVDAEIAQIVYEPSERRIPVVDLRPERPGYDTAVPVVDAGGAQLATIAVSAPTDPYVPPPSDTEFVLTDERYVTFPATIQNTGDAPFAFEPSEFSVLDSHGYLTREMPRGEVENDPTGPFLQPAQALAPGETATGLIKFLLRDDADPVAVVYIPDDEAAGDRVITVAESGLRMADPTSPPLFTPQEAVVTPGCENVLAWLNESFARLDNATGPALNAIPDDSADFGSVDPSVLHQAATELRDIGAAQAGSNPPAVAAAANDAFTRLIDLVADGYDRIADAVESGDQTAIDAAITESDETGQAFLDGEFAAAFGALAAACPEVSEVL